MKILFMGTPDFAVPILETLIKSEHDVIGVITQPDRPRGRGNKVQMPAVKEAAIEFDIPVYQPKRVKEPKSVEIIESLKPDIIVVAAFGQILSQAILDMPKYGCINVHGSLLPKYRGAAPIQWSIINGDSVSGVTIQQMVYALDEGDILLTHRLDLAEDETGGSLFERLRHVSGPLVLKVLDEIENGTLNAEAQNSDQATYAPMLSKATGLINWDEEAIVIERLIRGLNPWPSAYTYLNDKMMKIWEASVVEATTNQKPGFVETTPEGMLVTCGSNKLLLKVVQLSGSKAMESNAFLRGHQLEEGTILQ